MLLTRLQIENFRGIKSLDLTLGETMVFNLTYSDMYNGWRKPPSRFLSEMGLSLEQG